jgi:hypothetical protein
MPPIFKALATITAWALFISGWINALSTFLSGIITGNLYGAEPPMQLPVFFLVAIAQWVSAVVVMILRKKME